MEYFTDRFNELFDKKSKIIGNNKMDTTDLFGRNKDDYISALKESINRLLNSFPRLDQNEIIDNDKKIVEEKIRPEITKIIHFSKYIYSLVREIMNKLNRITTNEIKEYYDDYIDIKKDNTGTKEYLSSKIINIFKFNEKILETIGKENDNRRIIEILENIFLHRERFVVPFKIKMIKLIKYSKENIKIDKNEFDGRQNLFSYLIKVHYLIIEKIKYNRNFKENIGADNKLSQKKSLCKSCFDNCILF